MSRPRALLAAAFALGVLAALPRAQALPPFFAEFQATYLKPDSENAQEKEFAALVIEKVKCNVCHAAGKPKKERNAYGTQLAEILKKDNFKPERLKAEHREDMSYGEEVAEALLMVGTQRPVPGAEALGFMLRGFFGALRRHVAFEGDYVGVIAVRER